MYTFMMKVEKISKSLSDTEKMAEEFLKILDQKIKSLPDKSNSVVIGLAGDLGSGKTTFTQFIGKILGIKEKIQSPTFVIQKIYETRHSTFKKIYHIDLYRLEDEKEIRILNLKDIVEEQNNLILIEWPKKLGKGQFDKNMIQINFEFIDENTRKISYVL